MRNGGDFQGKRRTHTQGQQRNRDQDRDYHESNGQVDFFVKQERA